MMTLGGIVLALLGFVIWRLFRPTQRLRRRVQQTPTAKIAQARGEGPVEIYGKIVSCEQGVLEAPFSGRSCVLAYTVVERRRDSAPRHTTWDIVAEETIGVEFLVDDGSGEQARVIPKDANILWRSTAETAGAITSPSRAQTAFLERHEVSDQGHRMRFRECVLCADESIYALGPSFRENGGPLLLTSVGGDGEQRLVLTNRTEAELTSFLLWPSLIGIVLMVAGAVLVVAAVARAFV